MESLQSSKAEKQRKVASILDSMSSSRAKLAESKACVEVLKSQA